MSQINFDIVLYSSPYFENLVSELYRISRYKRNIYKKIRTEDEFSKKLSSEERTILKYLSEKENQILIEILANKQWLIKQKTDNCVLGKYVLNSEKFELLTSVYEERMFQQDIKEI
ncbi:MAG: hypothetical protein FD143_271 [Ignavibacteria bacterium]|nr:MAG: hypothetical protein FD143_271 [Ignavibacteria bacterium]KAF0160891.1 MAG: hypothetical protein FD188_1297 [Ignavibacteria bacterium]